MTVIDTTEGCRYCLMCRHVCPVTRVTYNEATSPHGWALAVASVRRGLLDWNAETANLLYQCADCGLCQSFCATDQPLPEAIVAARARIVDAGHAPGVVADIDAALRRWGRPHPPDPPIAMGEGAIPLPSPAAAGEGPGVRAETALFLGSAADEQMTIPAARALLDHLGFAHSLIAASRDSGYLAYTLGLHATARDLARATVEEVERAGCRTLVTLAPEHAYALKTLYPRLGAPLPADVEVVELTALLAGWLGQGRLRLRQAPIDLAYHDPCQTARLDRRWWAPRRLLEAITTQPLHESFWRGQRAASCGASGGLPWTQPRLAAQLARAALADAANSGAALIVTDAPGCLAHLRANAEPGVEVRSLYELLVEHLDTQ